VRFLLDTNVISEFTKRDPNPGVYAWLDQNDERQTAVSVISLGEIQNGIARLPNGKRKAALQDWLDNNLIPRFDGRILPLTIPDMLLWGTMTGEAVSAGAPLPTADAVLTAVARNRDLIVITRSEGDFGRKGVGLLNPWTQD
jgi:predicted nucleic acid-binding protein